MTTAGGLGGGGGGPPFKRPPKNSQIYQKNVLNGQYPGNFEDGGGGGGGGGGTHLSTDHQDAVRTEMEGSSVEGHFTALRAL